MKTRTVGIYLIVLGIAGVSIWMLEGRLGSARDWHDSLAKQAEALAIDAESWPRADRRKVEREQADRLVAEYLDASRHPLSAEADGAAKTLERGRRMASVLRQIRLQESGYIRDLIKRLQATDDLRESWSLVRILLADLARDHPEAALALISTKPWADRHKSLCGEVERVALKALAVENSSAALAWLEQNGKNRTAEQLDSARRTIVCGVAATDPKLAFSLVRNLGLSPAGLAAAILHQVKSSEARTAALAAYRESSDATDSGGDDLMSRTVLSNLAPGIAYEGFEAGSSWLANAALSPEEIRSIMAKLRATIDPAEHPQWLAWVADELPARQATQCISDQVTYWTGTDHPAVAAWLNTLPESTTRTTAVKAFIKRVASLDPQVARQWAQTLPPGTERDSAIRLLDNDKP